MSQQIHTFSKEKINKMHDYYKDSIVDVPQGAVFRAKTSNGVITAYRSGKVMFQGKAAEFESIKWVEELEIEPVKGKPNPKLNHNFTPPSTIYNVSHIGSDEAGTGDYFGPMTVACVFVKKEQLAKLKEIGVQDSKNLSDTTIKRLSKEILSLNILYSLLVLRNEKYNDLKARGWSQGKMKAMLHHHAIQNVSNKAGQDSFEGIVIDQFCEPGLYNKYIGSERQKSAPNTYFITKAESYSIAVAAASIIARTSFLKEMDLLSGTIGMTLPKGASKQVDQTIAQIIREKGHQALHACAKTHFVNTKKAEAYL
ncbi:ribonuclease HIII [Virgibacillus phasianinus]|uniref:Ribonuclease HIII n=1 Tax=Virgibacillus phasianinus TaxID=2017483 RepID=A0A220U4D1_9BACI|nr:ribonuclease HIII [Virgibacillus phasianinus]ASK63018.1 ribonuclease HIII [Virgibacillus phasianinus]